MEVRWLFITCRLERWTINDNAASVNMILKAPVVETVKQIDVQLAGTTVSFSHEVSGCKIDTLKLVLTQMNILYLCFDITVVAAFLCSAVLAFVEDLDDT